MTSERNNVHEPRTHALFSRKQVRHFYLQKTDNRTQDLISFPHIFASLVHICKFKLQQRIVFKVPLLMS